MENIEVPKESGKDNIYNLVKGTIGAIPIAGSIAAEVFGLILSSPINKRRENWMNAVTLKLKELEHNIANFNLNDLKDNEEFVSFLLEASQIAYKTHQEEKLHILKAIIGNFFTQVTFQYDKKYSFLKVVDEISPTHIKILAFLFEHEKFIIENLKSYQKLYEKYQEVDTELDKFHFRKCIKDLDNQSLIRVSKDFADFVGGSGYATDSGAPPLKILDYGYEFIEFIKN